MFALLIGVVTWGWSGEKKDLVCKDITRTGNMFCYPMFNNLDVVVTLMFGGISRIWCKQYAGVIVNV